jgi:hypothetical protein
MVQTTMLGTLEDPAPVGSVWGRYTVIGSAPREHRHEMRCVRCACGKKRLVQVSHLCKLGSCGSCARRRHGGIDSLAYRTWQAMWQRVRHHPRYIKRGITVCDEWKRFEAFLADMGDRPSVLHTLDRVDNNKGYSPDNCRWATPAQQARNREVSVLTEDAVRRCVELWEGGTMSAAEIARELGLGTAVVGGVIKGRLAVDITGREPSTKRLHKPGTGAGSEWARQALEAMAARGITSKDIMARTGISKGLLSQLLSGKMTHSSYLPAIADMLGLGEGTADIAPGVAGVRASRQADMCETGKRLLGRLRSVGKKQGWLATQLGMTQAGLCDVMYGRRKRFDYADFERRALAAIEAA